MYCWEQSIDSASVGCHDVLVVVESARKVRGCVLKPQVHHIYAYIQYKQKDDDATIRRKPNTASLIYE